MSIRMRLMIVLVGGFSVLAAVILALGIMTVTDYERMIARHDTAYLNAFQGERFNHLVSRVVMDSRGIYNDPSPEDAARFAGNINADLDEMQAQIKQWQATATPEDVARLRPLIDTGNDFIGLRREVARLALQGDYASAEKLGTGNRATRIAFQNELASLITLTKDSLDESRSATEAYGQQRIQSFIVAALAGLAIMMGLTLWMVARFVVAPARAVANAIIRTSHGDYGVKLQAGNDKTEMGLVWSALEVLKQRSLDAERFAAAQREAEREAALKTREIILD